MNDVVTESEIREILGPVEPPVVAAIRAMAATRDELEEATTSDDEPFENLADERIDELRAIIARRGIPQVAAPQPVAAEPPVPDDWRPQD
ncbi:MAG TPA: hypothetical protein VFQ65_26095 [Kofleriaceae bacterium]|nr:hypothetical protein [Kofleriaceae bacterium]